MIKKGQEGTSGVAILILLIALFMILYILLLPPETREDILNQTISKEKETGVTPRVLLSEDLGEVFPTKESNIVHDISPINIFIKTEPTTSILANSLELSRGLLSNKPHTLTFLIEDLTNIKSAILFFSVESSRGNLEIWLNDHIVLDQKIDSAQTIDLPVNYLKKNNELVLKASHPGLFFFTKNYYNLKDIGIKESYQRINPKEERRFTIPAYEKNSLQKAILSYQIYCNKLKDMTDFKILLNEKTIISKMITCIAGTEQVELPVENIKEGTNVLTFVIGDGDFQFSQIRVETELKEKSSPSYHFNLDDDEYDNVAGDAASVVLKLKLSGNQRRTNIIINDKQFEVDTNEDEFLKDISDYVDSGDNFIKIIPRSAFNIDLLEIKLQ